MKERRTKEAGTKKRHESKREENEARGEYTVGEGKKKETNQNESRTSALNHAGEETRRATTAMKNGCWFSKSADLLESGAMAPFAFVSIFSLL